MTNETACRDNGLHGDIFQKHRAHFLAFGRCEQNARAYFLYIVFYIDFSHIFSSARSTPRSLISARWMRTETTFSVTRTMGAISFVESSSMNRSVTMAR